jgi:hypothetical protein
MVRRLLWMLPRPGIACRPAPRSHTRPFEGGPIDFAAWTVDNARLAVLDAIDARVYADELATTAGSQLHR